MLYVSEIRAVLVEKRTRALSNGIECMLEGLGTSKSLSSFFFSIEKEKGGNGGTSLQLNELMSTGCTDALQQFSSFYIHFFEKLHLAVCFQRRESPVLR